MVTKDAYVPFALFADFGLPKLSALCHAQPRKLAQLVPLVFAFAAVDAEEHVKVVRKLQEAIADVSVFVQCLAVLIQHEREFSEKMMEMYTYYCMIGLRATSAFTRAVALSMLSVLLPYDQEQKLLGPTLDRMLDLVHDDWWEVQAQLAVAASTMLRLIGEDHPRAVDVYSLVQALLVPDAPVLALKVGLSAVAPTLASHPALLPHFVDVLLAAHEVRAALVHSHADEHVLHVSSSCRSEYRLPPMASQWYGLGVAQTIVAQVKDAGLGNLGAERIELLAAAVSAPFAPEDVDLWRGVFADLKDFILIELCDDKVCALVAQILTKFLYDPVLSQDAMAIMTPTAQGTVPPLFGILKFVYQTGAAEVCGHVLTGFLQQLIRTPASPFVPHLYSLVKNFAEKESAIFGNSALPDLMKEMEKQPRK